MLTNLNTRNGNTAPLDEVESDRDHPPGTSASPTKPAVRRPDSGNNQAGAGLAIKKRQGSPTAHRLQTRDVAPQDGAGSKPASEPDNQTTWTQSGGYIKGAVEYDLGSDTRELDDLKTKRDNASQRRDDTRKDWHSSKAGPEKKILEAQFHQAQTDFESADQKYETFKKTWQEDSKKHLAAAAPYEGGKLALDADNHLLRNKGAGDSGWVYSATDTRNVLAQAAQNAKTKIDEDLKRTWGEQVRDLRAWRKQNVRNVTSEDIERQLDKTAEAYLQLKQAAELRKDTVDAQVAAFGTRLDENAASAANTMPGTDNDSQNKLVDLMQQRQTNLDSAIADINDQHNLFASLSDKTVNDMRVGTDQVAERKFKSEDPEGATADGAHQETQTDVDAAAKQIEQTASNVAEAEHAISTDGMPTLDNHAKRELVLAKEMLAGAKGLAGNLENLAQNTTKLTLPGLGKWSFPGKTGSLTVTAVVGLVPALKDLSKQISDYTAKSQQGKLTGEDRFQLAKSVMSTIGTLSPFVPVIGPIVAPFLTVANTVMAMIDDNKKTPVENVASEIRSQTADYLTGGHAPIKQPSV